jgi:hypothetical protein
MQTSGTVTFTPVESDYGYTERPPIPPPVPPRAAPGSGP